MKITQGENRGGKTLVYHYDRTGINGFTYDGTTYGYAKDIQGNVVALIDTDGNVVAKYVYDAWGGCKVYDVDGNENSDSNFICNINPFRWEGHYFDTESGLYYANGSYYDPEVGLHVDAMPVSSIIENAFKVFCDFRLNN